MWKSCVVRWQSWSVELVWVVVDARDVAEVWDAVLSDVLVLFELLKGVEQDGYHIDVVSLGYLLLDVQDLPVGNNISNSVGLPIAN